MSSDITSLFSRYPFRLEWRNKTTGTCFRKMRKPRELQIPVKQTVGLRLCINLYSNPFTSLISTARHVSSQQFVFTGLTEIEPIYGKNILNVAKANHVTKVKTIQNIHLKQSLLRPSQISLFFLVFRLFTVIATMRDLKRKDKLVEAAGDAYGKTLSLAVLDVCNDESVKQCINGIKDRHVDVLSE